MVSHTKYWQAFTHCMNVKIGGIFRTVKRDLLEGTFSVAVTTLLPSHRTLTITRIGKSLARMLPSNSH